MESHEQELLDEIHDQNKVRIIQEDYTQVDFDPATRALLDYASKLTMDMKNMSKADIESLQATGFSDAAILDAIHIIGFFNFSNRVMDALGVEPEPDMRYGKK